MNYKKEMKKKTRKEKKWKEKKTNKPYRIKLGKNLYNIERMYNVTSIYYSSHTFILCI